MLERYEDEPPRLDESIRDALRDYVIRRECEIPKSLT